MAYLHGGPCIPKFNNEPRQELGLRSLDPAKGVSTKQQSHQCDKANGQARGIFVVRGAVPEYVHEMTARTVL